jgi:CheY-like chemotaxis protein
MSGEFDSLRMLVVAAARPDQELWRQAASLASVLIDLVHHDAASATKDLARSGADICVLDGTIPNATKAAVIAAARAAKPAPLVFVADPKGSPRVEGVDGMLIKPANAEDARKMVEICVRTKFPTRVLVVDDSSTMRSIVRKILSASRFALNVEEASEGIQAVVQLRSGNFGLAFLDYNMPGLNGLETLAEIKRAVPKVAVVMISSAVDEHLADKARAAGALAFLKKPFYPADIDKVLERFYGLDVPLR